MKHFSNRLLGIAGMFGAPWIFIDFIRNGLFERFATSSESGVHNFIFLFGWTCSVAGLYKIRAMGRERWQKVVVLLQLLFLSLALIWSVIEIFAPHSPSKIYFVLGFFWPIAGFFMLITGIVIFYAKQLPGWKRYVPLLAGFWYPFIAILASFDISVLAGLVISGVYATVAFILLGLTLVVADFTSASAHPRTLKSR